MQRSFIFASLILVAGSAHAQTEPPKVRKNAGVIYQQSLLAQKRSEACIQGIPGYAQVFVPVFTKWLSDNSEDIRIGEKEWRARAGSESKFQEEVEQFVNAWMSKSKDFVATHLDAECEFLLYQAGGVKELFELPRRKVK